MTLNDALKAMAATLRVAGEELPSITLRRTQQRLNDVADRLDELADQHQSAGAFQLIIEERERQIDKHGFTHEHDDEHIGGEIAGAAAAYAAHAQRQAVASPGSDLTVYPPGQTWRWSHKYWKPSADPIRNLVKAGALVVAEIERLQREQGEPV